MKALSEYSTEELDRLVNLTETTAKPGEYLYSYGFGPVLRIRGDARHPFQGVVWRDGEVRFNTNDTFPLRRIHSFTDTTPLDPPLDEMKAELSRRRHPHFKLGDVVVRSPDGLVAQVIVDAGDDCYEIQICGGNTTYCSVAKYLRLATDEERKRFYKVRCLKTGTLVVPLLEAGKVGEIRDWADLVDGSKTIGLRFPGNTGLCYYNEDMLRFPTLAERQAYETRSKNEISNRIHNGRGVRHKHFGETGIILSLNAIRGLKEDRDFVLGTKECWVLWIDQNGDLRRAYSENLELL